MATQRNNSKPALTSWNLLRLLDDGCSCQLHQYDDDYYDRKLTSSQSFKEISLLE